MDMNDDPVLTKVMIDRFEVRDTEHGKPVILEADAWFGKSIDKLWLKTDVEALDGEVEEAQLQVLYNRAISPFWDLQAGVRHDFKPAKRTWAALGVQGTAPYFIETKASAFLGEQGQAAISLSAEKEVMLTQKTVLIPELALNLYGKDDHELGVGSGLADLNLGLRLSYEIEREFAPYIGVNWSKKFGKTADMAEHHGEKTQDTQFLVGIKAWF
ncbi:MAG: copper resistance protein B [Thiothrix sp.]|nr:MAG: copper resistance protein B [Thiothrix sp.]